MKVYINVEMKNPNTIIYNGKKVVKHFLNPWMEYVSNVKKSVMNLPKMEKKQ